MSDYQLELQRKKDSPFLPLLQQGVEEYEALQQKKRLHNFFGGTIEMQNKSIKRKL